MYHFDTCPRCRWTKDPTLIRVNNHHYITWNRDLSCQQADASKIFQLYSPEKCRQEIDCYKNLYKLGKERKCSKLELFYILEEGFKSAALETRLIFNDSGFSKGVVFLDWEIFKLLLTISYYKVLFYHLLFNFSAI